MNEILLVVAVVAVPFLSYLLGVLVASRVEARAFDRLVSQFDEVTRDHREKTPRVRMTFYRRLIERTRLSRKIELKVPVSEPVALKRKYVFLNLKPPLPPESLRLPEPERDTVRMVAPPFDEHDTLRMRR